MFRMQNVYVLAINDIGFGSLILYDLFQSINKQGSATGEDRWIFIIIAINNDCHSRFGAFPKLFFFQNII